MCYTRTPVVAGIHPWMLFTLNLARFYWIFVKLSRNFVNVSVMFSDHCFVFKNLPFMELSFGCTLCRHIDCNDWRLPLPVVFYKSCEAKWHWLRHGGAYVNFGLLAYDAGLAVQTSGFFDSRRLILKSTGIDCAGCWMIHAIVVWRTMSCFAAWSKRRHVTFIIIECWILQYHTITWLQ